MLCRDMQCYNVTRAKDLLHLGHKRHEYIIR